MPEGTDLPDSSPEFAALLCLAMAVLGDDPKLFREAFDSASRIAEHISKMDLSLVRMRSPREDAKVRQDCAQAAAWLRSAISRAEKIGLV